MGWKQFEALLQENRDSNTREITDRPTSCPHDGELLEQNAAGVLHCPLGNFAWSG